MNKTEIYGYAGNILHIDLTSRRIRKEKLDSELTKSFIGGFGVNNKLAYDLIEPRIDSLSPQNIIIFAGGLLSGTPAPASSKVMATTKFPIPGAIATTFGGGGGDTLRLAGYDHVIVTGRAETPIFLKIFDDEIDLCDAGWLWGKDIWQTTDELRDKYGNECSVIAIGPPGERLVQISFAYVNKLGHLGQQGFGAVMGSKNLKALVIHGTKGVKVADRQGFMKATNLLSDSLMNLNYRDDYIRIGSGIASWGMTSRRRKLPPEEEAADIYGPAAYDRIFKGTLACPSCPIGCKALLEIKEGEHTGELAATVGAGRDWERFNVGSIHRALALRDFCNRQGIDDSAATSIINLAICLFEDGVITREDADGLELKRDYETARTLMWKISRREGLGDLLADGYLEATRRIGPRAENYARNVLKGHELGDPRSRHFQPMTIAALVDFRGHGAGIGALGPGFMPGHKPETFRRYLSRNMGVPEETIEGICTESNVNMAKVAKYAEDLYSLYSCLGVCYRQPIAQCYSIDAATGLYTALTGRKVDPGELLRAGERAWNILKLANVREGFTRQDDEPPSTWFEPLVVDGKPVPFTDYYGNQLTKEDIERLLDDYYNERGWDIKTSIPTPQKLEELGLYDETSHYQIEAKVQ